MCCKWYKNQKFMKTVAQGLKYVIIQPRVKLFIAYGKKFVEWPNIITCGIKLDGWPKKGTYGTKL